MGTFKYIYRLFLIQLSSTCDPIDCCCYTFIQLVQYLVSYPLKRKKQWLAVSYYCACVMFFHNLGIVILFDLPFAWKNSTTESSDQWEDHQWWWIPKVVSESSYMEILFIMAGDVRIFAVCRLVTNGHRIDPEMPFMVLCRDPVHQLELSRFRIPAEK